MSPIFDYSEHIATALALLTTYEGKLPIGAPTSPVISNFICKQLDTDLIDFAATNSLAYSRYADDLTFSSNSKIEQETIQCIRQLIVQNRFKVNERKFRLQTSNRKQTVTGITVNEKLNVDRKLLKKIRAMLHGWTTRGLLLATYTHFSYSNYGKDIDKLQQKFINRLEGYINFVGQVRGKNDLIYKRYILQYQENMKCLEPSDPNDPFNPEWH
jgi:RNA-directed DNA polymerase